MSLLPGPRPRRARRRVAWRWSLLPVLLAAGLVLPVVPAVQADAPPRVVSGWLPSWGLDQALANVTANSDVFDEASPFWHTATAVNGAVTLTTAVTDARVAQVVAELRGRGIRVLPSVADGSPARAMAAVLADPAARSAHVAQLAALVAARGYDGIELDYERFAFSDGTSTWAATRPNWVAFITELAASLHAQGKLLALAVPPIYSADRSASSGYWVYAFEEIAASVDSLRVMAYDYSVAQPGPIAPLAFVRKSLAWTVTVVPSAKIRVGIPAYGRIWVAKRADGTRSITGTCPASGVTPTKSFTTVDAATFLGGIAGASVSPTWDATTGEVTARFAATYTGPDGSGNQTSCVADHVAWWVDAQGAMARMSLVSEFGLGGAAFWQLSGVDAATFAALHGAPLPAPPTPTVTPTPTPSPPPSPTASPSSTAVTTKSTRVGVVAPAKLVAGAAITIKVNVSAAGGVPAGTKVVLAARKAGTSKWKKLSTATTAADGSVTFQPPAASASTYWRAQVLTAAGTVAASGRARTVVSRSVSMIATAKRPKAGHALTFTVKVTPAGSVRVTKQRWVKGRWVSLGSVRTTAKGVARFSVRPAKAGSSYTYRVVTAKTTQLAAGASALVTITAR